MIFTEIDLQSWPRGQMFHYFSQMAPTGYSLSVDVDVSALTSAVKQSGVNFFPAYLWLVTKNLNRQTEFKVAVKDGVVGYYDTLTPLYASFHEDDHTFSLMWTPFCDDFREFCRAYIANRENFGANHGVLCQPQTPPPANAYTVSCLPWVEFKHFAVHSYGDKPYFFRSVESGKFFQRDGRTYMPLSLTCHHATTDGWHVSSFLASLQEGMDNFSRYL